MKAVQLIAHGTPGKFELRELPAPQPGTGEVVVQVRACGLNHLDLWLEEAGLPLSVPLPRTPGCEVAGEVFAVGPEVSGWQPGERVAVQSNLHCGECEYCRRGEESFCLRAEMLGEFVGDAVPGVGVGRRFAPGEDVGPEPRVLAIEAEQIGRAHV